MSKISELGSMPGFPGGLLGVLHDLDARLTRLENSGQANLSDLESRLTAQEAQAARTLPMLREFEDYELNRAQREKEGLGWIPPARTDESGAGGSEGLAGEMMPAGSVAGEAKSAGAADPSD